MRVRSKSGIYYDISQSTYRFDALGITFVFSSQLNLYKFIQLMNDEVLKFNESVYNIYKGKFNFEFARLALVRFYTLLEKRDFYLIVEGKDVRCLEDLEFQASVVVKNSVMS